MRGFAQRLRSMPAALQRTAAEAALASARRGAELARSLAPVDSGALRSSIHAQKQGPGAAVIAGARHAAFVEYGTSCSAPRPYMLPMAREMRGEFVEEMIQAAREVLS